MFMPGSPAMNMFFAIILFTSADALICVPFSVYVVHVGAGHGPCVFLVICVNARGKENAA